MRIAALLLLIFACLITLVALIPCLGWANWLGIPVSTAGVIVGIIGLTTDKDRETHQPRNRGQYLATLIVCVVMIGVGSLRCLLGGGLL